VSQRQAARTRQCRSCAHRWRLHRLVLQLFNTMLRHYSRIPPSKPVCYATRQKRVFSVRKIASQMITYNKYGMLMPQNDFWCPENVFLVYLHIFSCGKIFFSLQEMFSYYKKKTNSCATKKTYIRYKKIVTTSRKKILASENKSVSINFPHLIGFHLSL